MRQRFDPSFVARRDRKSFAKRRLSGLRSADCRPLEERGERRSRAARPRASREIRFPEPLADSQNSRNCRSQKRGTMKSQDLPVNIPALQQMKRDGRKIVGVVAWDYQIAQIVDR